MSLAPGSQLGRYQIRAALGAGGMGEVYRAHDPETGREVAIKVSARRFDERFAREARLIASLNHPNICTLFDVGPDYLVMELVEGPTLAERIKQGAMPLDEALSVARQIAAALEYAHERPVIHRDLKPANIKIRPDGLVKVLDFGLAKVGTVAPSEDSPTLTMGLSEAGMILGTASYMSPEQARGLNVDKRADIWSFGVVLHEMLTGQRLFTGQTVPDILLSVISKPLDTEALPAEVRPLLERCLERDVRKRLRDMGDLDLLLREAPPAPVFPAPTTKTRWPWAVAALFAVGTASLAWLQFREAPAEPLPVVQFQLTPRYTSDRTPRTSVSPDGRWLAYYQIGEDNRPSLTLRDLSTLEEHVVPRSAGTNFGQPFWSPDSRFVAFSADGVLKKAAAQGGEAQTIAEGTANTQGSWNQEGVILIAQSDGLAQVPATGGRVSPIKGLIDPARGDSTGIVDFLPDGRHFVYAVRNRDANRHGTYAGSLESGTPPKRLLPEAALVARTPGGRVYLLSPSAAGQAHAQELDLQNLTMTGQPIPLAFSLVGPPSASNNGVLAVANRTTAGAQYSWYGRDGKLLRSLPASLANASIDLSRDGSSLATVRDNDLWIRDLARDTETRFTTSTNQDLIAIWSADGKQIAYVSRRGAGNIAGLYLKPSNGTTAEQPLLELDRGVYANDWSRDGRFLIYADSVSNTNMDLAYLPMDAPKESRKPTTYLQEPFNQKQAQFSPDGRFVAYASDESGNFEIYVRPFPDASAGKWTVSSGGGVEARWSKDGSELYYFSGRKLMAVSVKTAGGFSMGTPKELFEAPVEVGYSNDSHHWQVAPDGRFLILTFTESATSVITVITNWQELLKQ